MTHTNYWRVVQDEHSDTTEVEPVLIAEEGDTTSAEGDGHSEGEAVEEELHAEAEEETNNPILPTSNELFYGALFFMLLWALFKWVLLPPVLKTQEARAEKIRSDKDAAERAEAEAAALRSDYEAGLATARAEATRIIDDARQTAEGKRTQVMARVDGEIAEQRAQAAAEVESAKDRALAELSSGVTDLAVEAAGAVVQKDIDAASQRAAIDEYVSGAGR